MQAEIADTKDMGEAYRAVLLFIRNTSADKLSTVVGDPDV